MPSDSLAALHRWIDKLSAEGKFVRGLIVTSPMENDAFFKMEIMFGTVSPAAEKALRAAVIDTLANSDDVRTAHLTDYEGGAH
jgi:hypothetical protein